MRTSLFVAVIALAVTTVAAADPSVVAIVSTHAQGPCASVDAFGQVWVTDIYAGKISTIDPRTNPSQRPEHHDRGSAVRHRGRWRFSLGERLRHEQRRPGRSASPQARRSIAVGAQPYDVAYGYGSVWTTNNGDGTVDRIDPTTDKIVQSYDTRSTPTGLSITGGYVWIGANSGSQIFRLDPRTNRLSRVDVHHQSPAWFAADATHLWVASNVDDVVLHLDPRTGKVLAAVKVGLTPQDGTIGPDGSVWVPDMGDDTVSRVDPATNKVTATIHVGPKPFVLSTGDGDVWAPSYGGSDVRRIAG